MTVCAVSLCGQRALYRVTYYTDETYKFCYKHVARVYWVKYEVERL